MANRARRKPTRMKWNLLVAAGTILAIAILLVMASWPPLQHQTIRVERLTRVSLWKAGIPLAGTPDFSDLAGRLQRQGLKLGAPVFIRIFKREFELELWLLRDGRFHHFATYPICKWSGRLGPKLRQGDHQSPEGFYTVAAGAMNPNSRWHRSFNLGFPNAYDRQHGRTGSYLMVHGGCSSVGCYAVTDAAVDEIWRITRAAHRAGQRRFHVHAYPFRMTDANMRIHRSGDWRQFWADLKNGYDAFETTHLPPRIHVCRRRYVVTADSRPSSRGAHAIQRGCPPPHVRFATGHARGG